MPKITQSDYETQQLAYLRRIVDALEHISLTLLNISSMRPPGASGPVMQTQHPSVGTQQVRIDPMTIDAPAPKPTRPPGESGPLTQDIVDQS